MEKYIIKKLKPIIRGVREDMFGLCMHIVVGLPSNDKTIVYSVIEPIFRKWPHFSGSILYPIPDVCSGDPSDAFNNTFDMYTGEYGKLRLELAQFMIDNLEERLNART